MMSELAELFRELSVNGCEERLAREHELIERVTFAGSDELVEFVENVSSSDFLAMPVWLRNLAYRLAVLQAPDDPRILRKAAADILCFGPDWDEYANALLKRAMILDGNRVAP